MKKIVKIEALSSPGYGDTKPETTSNLIVESVRCHNYVDFNETLIRLSFNDEELFVSKDQFINLLKEFKDVV